MNLNDAQVDISPRSGGSAHRPGFHRQRIAAADANLHLVLAGSMRYSGNAGRVVARAGDLVAIPLGRTFTESDGPDRRGVQLAVVHAQVRSLPQWPDRITRVRPEAGEREQLLVLGTRLTLAASAWKQGDTLAGIEARGLAQALIAVWFRLSPGDFRADHSWAAPLLERIEAALDDPAFGLADLAAASGLSRSQFSRRFASAVGMPPARYLESRRMRTAMHHLAEGATIAATAERCGYRDPYHFSRVFKRCTGLAPAHWQARLDPS